MSRQRRIKKKMPTVVDDHKESLPNVPEMPVLTRAESKYTEPVMSTEDFDDAEDTHYWFISDCPMDKNIHAQFADQFSHIRDWSRDDFANRPPHTMLNDYDVQHIWTNITDKHAAKYVKSFVKTNTTYTTVLVRRSLKNSKHSKWVRDLMDIEDAIDHVLQQSDLKNVHALTLDELFHSIEDQIELHAPPTCFGMITGLSNKVISKNARSK